jgi:AcrR family transcriptional regulator
VYALEFAQLQEAIEEAAAAAADPTAALRAVCRAYCDYAQQNPARYRALTGVRGQLHPEWQGQPMPGAQAFAVLHRAVAAVLRAQPGQGDAFLAAATLWAGLHGIVTLRATRPAFAWPSLDDMIDQLIRQMLG